MEIPVARRAATILAGIVTAAISAQSGKYLPLSPDGRIMLDNNAENMFTLLPGQRNSRMAIGTSSEGIK